MVKLARLLKLMGTKQLHHNKKSYLFVLNLQLLAKYK